VQIGRHARVRRAIIDNGVHIADGAESARFPVTDRGIVVIAKGHAVS